LSRNRPPAARWRIAIGTLFVVTGLLKIGDPTGFIASILTYHLPLSATAIKGAAVVVPWLELLTGLLLVVGVWVDAGLITASGLSLVFLALGLQAAFRGLSVQCGCFGSFSERLPGFLNSLPFIIGRDILLVGATLALTRAYFVRRKASQP
jgi:hypothetical protein